MRYRIGNQSWPTSTRTPGELSQVAGGTSLSGTQDGSSSGETRQGKMEEDPQSHEQAAESVTSGNSSLSLSLHRLGWGSLASARSGTTPGVRGDQGQEDRSNRHPRTSVRRRHEPQRLHCPYRRWSGSHLARLEDVDRIRDG